MSYRPAWYVCNKSVWNFINIKGISCTPISFGFVHAYGHKFKEFSHDSCPKELAICAYE